MVNLRDRMNDLSLCQDTAESPKKLRYIGSCHNDRTQLKPEHLIMLQVAPTNFQPLHIHRTQLLLATEPQVT